MVAKTAPKYVSQIPGGPSLTEIQKKKNIHGRRTYPAKGTINVIFFNTKYIPCTSNLTSQLSYT